MTLIANHTREWFPRTFERGIKTCGLSALLVGSWVCPASQVERLAVTHSDGEYRLEIVSLLNAPANYAYDVITDYQHAYRLNPSIVEVEVLPVRGEDAVQVRNRSEHWFGPFRFHIDWTGEIRSSDPSRIDVVTIPENSSFESGHAVWKIRPQGDGTLVEYRSSLRPNFFIPPVIGEMIMEYRIREETLAIFQRIECHARLLFELDLEQEPEQLRKLIAGRDKCIKLNG